MALANYAGMCPECGGGGTPVGIDTVKSNLAISLRRVEGRQYHFCGAESCPVAYFASDGPDVFHVHDLRDKIYQKQPDDDATLVCYCFQHSVGDIRSASPEARAAIAADITQGTKTGQCACELRNPQGSCCLGNVRALIRRCGG